MQSYLLCAIKGDSHWTRRLGGAKLGCAGSYGGAALGMSSRRAEGRDVSEKKNERAWRRRRKRIEGTTQYVRVSMSEVERAQLYKMERETGLSASALMVQAALGSADPVAIELRRQQLAELLTMRRYMATIANNVNQVARHFNTTSEIGSEAAQTFREAREFSVKALAVIEDLTP